MPKLKGRNDPNVLRDQIDGTALLRKVLTLVSYLEQGWMPEYSLPRDRPVAELTSADFKVCDWINLSPPDIARIKQALDFYMRLLNKVLPDLKSVDVHDSREMSAQATSPEERALRLFSILRRSPQGQQLLNQLTQPGADNLPSSMTPKNTFQ